MQSLIYPKIDDAFASLVPTYKSKQFDGLAFEFGWDGSRSVARHMWTISEKRCQSRIDNYIIPGELERTRGAIRFGNKKEGHGYHGERGDFCMVGAVYDRRKLTVFYRSLELIGGLHYDLAVFRALEDKIGDIKTISIIAVRSMIFALKGNSNEKLYQKLSAFYESRR